MKYKGIAQFIYGVIAIMAVTLVAGSSKAYAAIICEKQYGGGEICKEVDGDLEVDKKIYNPKSKNYENNINRKDGSYPYTFEEGEEIKFRIVVRNTGDIKIEDIRLIDVMPSIIEYTGGDGDEDNDRVEFDEFDLDPDEEKEFEFEAEVDFNGVSPDDDYICVSNVARAKGELKDSDDEVDDTDYANFCVDTEDRKGRVLGKETISRLPTTGLDTNLLFIGMSGLGLTMVGLGLRRISKPE